jgi:hypothetical protein
MTRRSELPVDVSAREPGAASTQAGAPRVAPDTTTRLPLLLVAKTTSPIASSFVLCVTGILQRTVDVNRIDIPLVIRLIHSSEMRITRDCGSIFSTLNPVETALGLPIVPLES